MKTSGKQIVITALAALAVAIVAAILIHGRSGHRNDAAIDRSDAATYSQQRSGEDDTPAPDRSTVAGGDGALTGSVRTADGKPLAGAEVMLSGPRLFVDVYRHGKPWGPSVKTGRDGRFSLSPGKEVVRAIVVRCAAGFAQVAASEFPNGGEITVQPWGRAEGSLRSGTLPLAGELVQMYRPNPKAWEEGIYYGRTATTDENGHFVFTRVAPGEYGLAHRVEQVMGDQRAGTQRRIVDYLNPISVHVDSEKMVRADLGGNGRRVFGKVVVEGEDEPVEFVGFVRQARGSAVPGASTGRFPIRVAADGSFRVDNLPHGDYELTVDARRQNRSGDFLPVVATIRKSFTLSAVSGVGSDSAFDLGLLTAQATKCLKAGQTAPPFEARGVNGQSIKLSDSQGKYTLLQLWSAGDGMWPEQQQNLKSIFDRFGTDSPLVVLSLNYGGGSIDSMTPIVAPQTARWIDRILSLGQTAPTTKATGPTTKATGPVPLAGIPWPQGFLEDPSKVAEEYFNSGGVVCLIGPDGTILSVCQGSLRPIYAILDSLQTPDCRGSNGVKVISERVPNDQAKTPMSFTSVPALSKDDAAANAVFTVVDGQVDPRGAGVQVLNDGLGARGQDVPTDALFFRDWTLEGRLRVDLGRALMVGQINTYSWHRGERGPQVYRVYGSNSSGKSFNPAPSTGTDPAGCGWKLIAAVDTRTKVARSDTDATTDGGQYGVSIRGKDGGVVGQYRYLLFVAFVTESRTPWGSGHTFYNEIDVAGRQ